ncbi:MAG: flavodoxin domain-containing protein [Trebonia sp.]|uniref:flavodoxin family protein n=1 Tax=Trebonia sp. TaxID=2767075 RepID=UPI003C7192DB
MRALVVYESMYGNTHAVAVSIAAGLSTRHDVTLVPVTRATPELVAATDLLVVGGPTHLHRMSTAASRRWAADAARKQGGGLTMDPDADGPGVRGWLEGAGSLGSLGGQNTFAVAFDTRLSGVPLFTGRASRGISRLLAGQGCRTFAAPESFLVSKKDTLRDGEAARARAWGAMIGAAASDLYAPVS